MYFNIDSWNLKDTRCKHL